MTEQKSLLNKYYKGETSIEEEAELRSMTLEDSTPSSEKDIFGFYENANMIPADLDNLLLSSLENRQNRGKSIRLNILRAVSVAAVVLIVLSVLLDVRYKRNIQMENDFFVMEHALSQVSESLQPAEQEEMLVLWVDENVEIIIN